MANKSENLRAGEVTKTAEIKKAPLEAMESTAAERGVGSNSGIRPEWLRPSEVRHYFGIGRGRAYEWIREGKLKTVSLRKRGQKHGTRLISYDSIAALLESLAEGGDS